MPATRIVIDVQPTFPAANKPSLVVGVALEMLKAVKERAHILFVEYEGYGATHKAIRDMLKGYKNLAKIRKCDDGGGHEVARGLQKNCFPYNHLRVCGVNTDCCVHATVREMVGLEIFRSSKIEMVKNACEWAKKGKYDWRKFQRHKNIVLA